MHNDDFQISINPQQQLCVSGSLDVNNVKDAAAVGVALINNLKTINVDLSGVCYADSTSLAMLVAWIRIAQQQHKDIMFCNTPQFMLDLGRVCGLDTIFPIGKSLHFPN